MLTDVLTNRTDMTDPQLPPLKSLPEGATPQASVAEKEGEKPHIVTPKAVNAASGSAIIGRSIAAFLSEHDSQPVFRASPFFAQEFAREEA